MSITLQKSHAIATSKHLHESLLQLSLRPQDKKLLKLLKKYKQPHPSRHQNLKHKSQQHQQPIFHSLRNLPRQSDGISQHQS